MNFGDAVKRTDEACLRVFGQDVTYLPQSGGQASIRAIFQPIRETEEASPGVYGVIFVRPADLPEALELGDEVEIGGARYKVFDIEADQEGGVVLRLRKID
jgi:hypothetical protein